MQFKTILTATFTATLTIAILGCLQGCSSDQGISFTSDNKKTEAGQEIVTLNPVQTELYQASLKQIIPNPGTANFIGVKALKFPTEIGIHICGYVKNNNEKGEIAESQFYIELRQEADKDIVHRGQVGSDPEKLAKVKFVCRHHEGGKV